MLRRYIFILAKFRAVALLALISQISLAQVTYFHQDFAQSRSFVNATPDTGQFSHIIQTVPALSYSKFYKGHMDLVRTQQDSATGGIIRALRATPFSPNPETLFIQIRMSAELIQSSSVNALYLYAGENFDPEHNSFPGNALMFAKCAINFQGSSFALKDLGTLATSKEIEAKKTVTLTWVLNNSEQPHTYKLFPADQNEYITLPGSYDLWVDHEPVSRNSKAYPGNSMFSKTKLSNFEIRFRNGIGKIRIDEMLIREAASHLKPGEVMVTPNPITDNVIRLKSLEVDPLTLQLFHLNGRRIPIKRQVVSLDNMMIYPQTPMGSGMYILSFRNKLGRRKSVRVMVE
ncbi:MAG: T9SS type A sorting domain-containing protein [Dyadobacter sp.]|uniref:T9SS type A sorting domain-containing protein n=1 Tax=Dyadobacter sp. TaxID=1914288 RepID=UPI003265F2BC